MMKVCQPSLFRYVEPQPVNQIYILVRELRRMRPDVEIVHPVVRLNNMEADLPFRFVRQPFPRVANLFRLVFGSHHR